MYCNLTLMASLSFKSSVKNIGKFRLEKLSSMLFTFKYTNRNPEMTCWPNFHLSLRSLFQIYLWCLKLERSFVRNSCKSSSQTFLLNFMYSVFVAYTFMIFPMSHRLFWWVLPSKFTNRELKCDVKVELEVVKYSLRKPVFYVADSYWLQNNRGAKVICSTVIFLM